MKNIAFILKEIRRREGYSIKELSKATNVSNKTIGDIEHGNKLPNKDFVKRLSEVLNTNLLSLSE